MPALEPPSLHEIRAARERLAGLAMRTPLVRLNVEDAPAEIHLKLEGHAPQTKPAAVERLGARAIKVPFDAWWQTLVDRQFPGVEGVFIHPVSDRAVMAGNGTIALEILYRPSFVDGIGGKGILAEMWPLASRLRDDSLVVPLEAVAGAIRVIAERNRVGAEGAGAAPVAAALAGRAGRGKVVCIVSGGNIRPGQAGGHPPGRGATMPAMRSARRVFAPYSSCNAERKATPIRLAGTRGAARASGMGRPF